VCAITAQHTDTRPVAAVELESHSHLSSRPVQTFLSCPVAGWNSKKVTHGEYTYIQERIDGICLTADPSLLM
jgi:hypothetical protein